MSANAPVVPTAATSPAPSAGPTMIARWKVLVRNPFATTSESPSTRSGTVAIIAGWNNDRNAPSVAATATTWSHVGPLESTRVATAKHRTRSATIITVRRGYRSTIGPAIVRPTTADVRPSTPRNTAVARTN